MFIKCVYVIVRNQCDAAITCEGECVNIATVEGCICSALIDSHMTKQIAKRLQTVAALRLVIIRDPEEEMNPGERNDHDFTLSLSPCFAASASILSFRMMSASLTLA